MSPQKIASGEIEAIEIGKDDAAAGISRSSKERHLSNQTHEHVREGERQDTQSSLDAQLDEKQELGEMPSEDPGSQPPASHPSELLNASSLLRSRPTIQNSSFPLEVRAESHLESGAPAQRKRKLDPQTLQETTPYPFMPPASGRLKRPSRTYRVLGGAGNAAKSRDVQFSLPDKDLSRASTALIPPASTIPAVEVYRPSPSAQLAQRRVLRSNATDPAHPWGK